MSARLTRRALLGGVTTLLAGPALARVLRPRARPEPPSAPEIRLRPRARPEPPAPPTVEELLAKARLGGAVSFSVADAATGVILEEHEAESALPPASVTKALTALYARDVLGPEHRFHTRVLATGPVEGGVLKGDLILAGGGDPTLDTDALATLAQRLVTGGIRAIEGRFLVDGSALPAAREIDSAQPAHVGYNPAVSGIALNFNRVHFGWTRKGQRYDVTMDARSATRVPPVRIARMRVEARSLPVYDYRDANGIDDWSVARTALGNGGARWLPVRRPALYAGDVFRTLAAEAGLRLPAAAEGTGTGRVVAEHLSAPLDEVLRDMLKYSTNLTAEMCGLAATAKRSGRPESLVASAEEMVRWAEAKLGLANAQFVDHSGLGDASRIAPRALVTILLRAQHEGFAALLKKIKPRNDARKVLENSPIRIRAKTGTLNFVSALAGYATGRDGTEIAFAIIAADTGRRAAIPIAERERPEGALSYNRRAKILQQALIRRWTTLYAT